MRRLQILTLLWVLEDRKTFTGINLNRVFENAHMYFSVFEAELGDVIPVVHTSIGGTRIIGRLTAG